jgi:hypothetical protein
MIMIEKAFEMREKVLEFLQKWKVIQLQNLEDLEVHLTLLE